MKQKLTTEAMQEIYEAAVHSEASGSQEAEFELLCKLEDVGGTSATIRKLIDMVRAANREAQPVELHMGVAMEVFDTLRDAMLSSRVENSELGAMGATKIEVWSSKIGVFLEMHQANGGCTLKVFTAPPAPAVPEEKPKLDYNPSMSWGDQCVAIAEIRGWNACRAAMLAQPVSSGYKLVPVEPTEEMCNVQHIGVDVYTGMANDGEYYSIGGSDAAKVYRAMLAAAPEVGK